MASYLSDFGVPDFAGRFISGYEAGTRMRERSKLAELDERGRRLAGEVAGGQKNKLAELMSINPQLGMQVKQFTDQEKAQRLDELAAGAMAADTPEKWQAFVERSAAQGHVLDPGETRESILDQAMGWKEKLAQSNADRQFNASQTNAARSYDLQKRGFDADQSYRQQQLSLEQQKLAMKDPDLVELYDEASGQPYKARYNPQTRGYDRVGGVKAPNGTQLEVGPDGTVKFNQGMGKLTEGQSKDVGYLARMTEAVPIIDQMGENLLNFGENVGGRAPLVGNYLKSPEYQQAEQAAGQWRQGFLRKDSGATITDQETADTNRLYIPQPGDKPPVLRQKAQARRTATLAVKMGIPYQAVMEMQKNGIDLDGILKAPLPGSNARQGGKGDMNTPGARKTKTGIQWRTE